MVEEFKKFIAQGSVLELAIGVIIGGAFGKIVQSLVNDIIMPLISLVLKGVNVTEKFVALDYETYASMAQAKEKGVAVLAYGNFLQNMIDFLMIAFVLFLVVRQANKMKPPVPAPVK